jgi:hypothetical protein
VGCVIICLLLLRGSGPSLAAATPAVHPRKKHP